MPNGIGYELGQIATGQRKGEPVGQSVAVDPFAPRQQTQQAQPARRKPKRQRRARRVANKDRARKNKMRALQQNPQAAAQGLMSKLVFGTDLPGEGMIPFAQLPQNIRQSVKLPAPAIGWNPDKLNDVELALLQGMVQKSKVQRGADQLTQEELMMLQNGG